MKKSAPKLFLQVSVQELHNSTGIPPEKGGLKEARDQDNSIIISDSTLWNILPPQLKIMTSGYKVMCGCECCISAKSMHSSLLSWCGHFLKKLKIKAVIHKTESLVEFTIICFGHIKIMSCHMKSIYLRQNMTWIVFICITTLKTCFGFWCEMHTDLSSNYRIRSAQFNC